MYREPIGHILRLFSIALLAGCSNDSSQEAEPPPTPPLTAAQNIAAMESRGELPVLDRTTSLKGTDVNADGLRDDLERYIAALPDTATQKSALRQLAKSLDSAITVDTTNDTALRAAAGELTDAINCVWGVYSSDDAPRKVEEMRRLSINTRERYNAYAKYNQARSGAVIALPSGSTCK